MPIINWAYSLKSKRKYHVIQVWNVICKSKQFKLFNEMANAGIRPLYLHHDYMTGLQIFEVVFISNDFKYFNENNVVGRLLKITALNVFLNLLTH